VSRKKKIILISVAVTLALVLSVGGLAPVLADNLHPMPRKYRLLGVGWCAKYEDEQPELWKSTQTLDTMFIITNPNCNRTIHLDWLFIIDENEEIVKEREINEELSPHQVWEFYLSEELIDGKKEEKEEEEEEEEYTVLWKPPEPVPKYTVEIMWSGVYYSRWWGWRDSPCTGWMKQLITTETWEWAEDACQCVDDPEYPCDPGYVHCIGGCITQATIPGVDCSECDCQCPEFGPPCTCQPEFCGGWVATTPVTEVSESQMVVYQPARVR
jgi:hypothetical protein